MGLDTFPLLQDQTFLITYSNTVFKLKLEYQEISQEKKEIFVEIVSEPAAHCQIEDVCRAVLYSIEREEQLSPIQTDYFVIYPEVCKWPLGQKVIFIVDGKPLSCHQELILLKLTCKDVAMPEKDVSPSSKRKLPSCRPLCDMSLMRARNNNQTNKKTIIMPFEDAYLYSSNANITMPCVNDNAAIVDTPVLGINNSRGGQSPKSINKITTIIQKHSIKTQLPTTNDHINLEQLSKTKPTRNKMSVETDKNNILPGRCANEITKLTDQKRKKHLQEFVKNKRPKLVSLMNTDMSISKGSCCDLSQDDSTQDTQINTSLIPTAQQARKANNKTMQKIMTVQLEVERNKTSDNDYELGQSDSSVGQVDRDLTHLTTLSSSHSTNSKLYSSKHSGDGNILNKEKLVLKMVTRLESQKRKNVNSTCIHQGVIKNNRTHSKLQRQTLRNKADGDMVTSLNAELTNIDSVRAVIKKYKQESRRNDGDSSETGSSEHEIINERSIENRKYQGQVGKIKHYNNSLEIAGKNVAEISDDGSIVNESGRMDHFDSVISVTPTVAVKDQNEKRKSHSSTKYAEYDIDRQQECSSSGLSQKLDIRTLKRINNIELIADQNSIGECGIPAKKQIRSRKAPSSSNFGSVKSLCSKGQQLKVKRNLEKCSNIDRSFMSLRSQIRSNRREQDSRLHYGQRYTDINGSTIAAHNNTFLNNIQTIRPDVERSLSDSPKISSCFHRTVKEYSSNDSGAIKSSKNHEVYSEKKVGMKIQKKVSTDFDNERTQKSTSDRTNSSTTTRSSTLNSSKRVTRSLSVRDSRHRTTWSSNTMQTMKKSLSNLSEMSSKGADTPKVERKLRKAQQQLLKSKDGVWLFWKS